jgi:hypothetical protein
VGRERVPQGVTTDQRAQPGFVAEESQVLHSRMRVSQTVKFRLAEKTLKVRQDLALIPAMTELRKYRTSAVHPSTRSRRTG